MGRPCLCVKAVPVFPAPSVLVARASSSTQPMGKSAKIGRMPALAKNKQLLKGSAPSSSAKFGKNDGISKKGKVQLPGAAADKAKGKGSKVKPKK